MKSSFPISITQALIPLVSVPICTGTITLWVIFLDLLGVLSMLYTGMDLASRLDSSLNLMTTLGWMKIPPHSTVHKHVDFDVFFSSQGRDMHGSIQLNG